MIIDRQVDRQMRYNNVSELTDVFESIKNIVTLDRCVGTLYFVSIDALQY